jgi:hypothetical protein
VPTPSLLQAFAAKPAAAGGFSPLDLPDLVAWWDFSDTATITASSGAVSAVTDKSGNGWDLAQATAANKPVTGTRTINSLNTLDFFASSPVECDWMAPSATIMSGVTAATALYVMANDSDGGMGDPGGNGAVLCHWGVATGDHEPYTDSNVYHGWGSTARKSTGNPTPALTTPRQITIVSKSGGWRYAIDGTDHFTTGTNTVGWAGTPKIGSNTTSGNNFCFDGRVGEIIICSSELTGGDLTDAQDYLQVKWGTA